MTLETKPLNAITESDLLQLIDSRYPEGKKIEYKRDHYGKADKDKKEFLFDVSSFANAGGGHLIIGVDEENGLPVDLCGIDISNPDQEILSLAERIQYGISPRVPGIDITAINLSNKTYAIVIRIPQSWQSPHMVKFKDSTKFYSRNSGGKYLLDVGEIRTAFLLSETAIERIREFRTDRISRIDADIELPFSVGEGTKAVLHFVPLQAFSPAYQVDLQLLTEDQQTAWYTILGKHNSQRGRLDFNFDGVVSGSASDYLQIYRNGIIEYVSNKYYRIESTSTSRAGLSVDRFEKEQMKIVGIALSIYSLLEIQLPAFCMISVLNARGLILLSRRISWDTGEGKTISKYHLIAPEILIETLDLDVPKLLKTTFDVVWNAGGIAYSWNYDEEGNRK